MLFFTHKILEVFKADGSTFSETFRSQTEGWIQLQPSSLIGTLNHFFSDCCIFSCNRHWLNFSAVLWNNVVGNLLHSPSVFFGQKKLFNSSSAEPSGRTRDLYCILNYFSCLFLDPQTPGRGCAGWKHDENAIHDSFHCTLRWALLFSYKYLYVWGNCQIAALWGFHRAIYLRLSAVRGPPFFWSCF